MLNKRNVFTADDYFVGIFCCKLNQHKVYLLILKRRTGWHYWNNEVDNICRSRNV